VATWRFHVAGSDSPRYSVAKRSGVLPSTADTASPPWAALSRPMLRARNASAASATVLSCRSGKTLVAIASPFVSK
jgi:hypothetical protein